MRLEIEPGELSALQGELSSLAPWQNQYELGPETYTGYFKYHGIEPTCCTPSSPPETRAALAAAFEDYMAGDPYFIPRTIDERISTPSSILDIATGTGRFAFDLALRGHRVHGVEIRENQITQARRLQEADRRLADAALTFDYVPDSADVPTYMGDEPYDVVISSMVLYHLPNPVQHLANLARLSKRLAVIFTMVVPGNSGWTPIRGEDAGRIVSGVSGVGWIPALEEARRALLEVGFAEVELVKHPLVAPVQGNLEWQSGTASRLLAAPVPVGIRALWRKEKRRRWLARHDRELPDLLRRYASPAHVSLFAWK